MTKKLRIRFIVIAMEAFLAVLVVLLATLNIVYHNSVYATLDRKLEFLARSGLGPTRGMLAIVPEKLQDWVDLEAEGIMQEDHYFIFSGYMREDLRRVETANLSEAVGEDVEAFLAGLLTGESPRGNLGNYRYYVTDLDRPNYKIVFLNAENEFFSIRSLRSSSLLVGGGCFVLVFALVALLSGQAVRPFVENIERQKRFITDASHEIKTPLGIIAADVDMLALEHGESEWTQSARGQIDRLASLADGLVILSRLEESVTPPEDKPYRPQERVRAVLDALAPLARDKALVLETALNFVGELQGSGTEFEHLCLILLENAVKYSPAGRMVDVRLSKAGRRCRLTVSNDCESPEEIDTRRIFDRFYRTEAARAQGHGNGIGLSIARNIADSQLWKLSARLDGGRITFTVDL